MLRKVIFLLTIVVAIGQLYISGRAFAAAGIKRQAEDFQERHKDKAVIYLRYDIEFRLNADWSSERTYVEVLKILNEKGKRYGEIPIPYQKDWDEIVGLRAYTITPEGKKNKQVQIRDIRPDDEYALNSGLMIKMVTFSQVDVGATTYLEYTVKTKGMPTRQSFWRETHFGESLPTKEINITMIFPKSLNIQHTEFNYVHPPHITEDETTMTYYWHHEDVDDPDRDLVRSDK